MDVSRRHFLASGAALAAAGRSSRAATPGQIQFAAQPFPMTQVRLGDGPFRQAQEANHRVLNRIPVDRLVHNFRLNAGLPSKAEPLGGWERPDCELRGHFTGHFLSALSLMHSSTGDSELKAKANSLVSELAQCQKALGNGYLSAFPLEFWARLKARKPVWAPYYTLHKIMAGLLDAYQLLGNEEALQVLEGVAGWVDKDTEPLAPAHMQDILNTEFGGMNEVLYNLWGVTGNERYAIVAHRFDHARIYRPLAARRDELKGLHANTNVPKIIGAARRYELSGQTEYRDIADYFWTEVTTARTYATGGTSNDEHWLTEPRHLAEELAKSRCTIECCVAYNLLKLTRHLYQWDPRPSYFDYYERTLFNHRLGTIDTETGATMYFLPLRAGAWKVYNTPWDSFWCCTGSGVEEYSKLNDSIYFHDDSGIYVNLFIASELDSPDRGLRLRQQTRFPDEDRTLIVVDKAPAKPFTVRVRVPFWTAAGGGASVNGKPLESLAAPGSYLTVTRTWKPGDRLELRLPMAIRTEPLADDPSLAAVCYGPLVLAAEMGPRTADPYQKDQGLNSQPIMETPTVELPLESTGKLRFRSKGMAPTTLLPLYQARDQRYSAYVLAAGA